MRGITNQGRERLIELTNEAVRTFRRTYRTCLKPSEALLTPETDRLRLELTSTDAVEVTIQTSPVDVCISACGTERLVFRSNMPLSEDEVVQEIFYELERARRNLRSRHKPKPNYRLKAMA